MKLKNKLGFTLVELLVVITILAIISVVAYQNFGGAVDKAVSGRKISDVSTIEAALQQFKSDNNYYPAVEALTGNTSTAGSNLWGYTGGLAAKRSNTLDVNYTGEEITGLVSANGGGKVFGTGSLSGIQIGAKGTISRNVLGKKYLSKDLYDPEVGDLKVGAGNKLIDYGIGRYVYAVYNNGTWAGNNKTGSNYNIAYTVKKEGSDTYVTKIVGDFDKESCFTNNVNCPDTLVGSGGLFFLKDGTQKNTNTSTNEDQGLPYPVKDFE